MITKHAMRWFGPQDPVSLKEIHQAGARTIVTALHHIPVGEVWSLEEIEKRQRLIPSPLKWEVVESLPVHEDIKKGKPERFKWIENYKNSLRNLAASGIFTVCYNFMPVLDWSRTQLQYELEDGSIALRFDLVEFAAFDLYILKRENAEYPEDLVKAAQQLYKTSSPETLKRIENSILLGLPGSNDAFELNSLKEMIQEYRDIPAQQLKENLYYFIREVSPVAEECGIRLCIHPDDPPFPLLGLPRVVSTEEDLAELMEAYASLSNGITFCTGSLGVREDNDLLRIFHRWADRVHFLHLRSTLRSYTPYLSFYEARHLEGDVNMYQILKAVYEEQKRRAAEGRTDVQIPMRPDHGHALLNDAERPTYPGYTAIGRLKALAELRGIEYTLTQVS
jgi:mannonate dehydratase